MNESSESQKRQISDNESVRFEDSSDEEVVENPQLNKYEDHNNRGIFFVSSSVEITTSHHFTSEED